MVQAPMPKTKPLQVEAPFIQQAVLQNTEALKRGPTPNQPWFKRRVLLPIPPENSPPETIPVAGLHPALLRHNHSPALEVCPNGDVLAIFFTCAEEYTADVALLATRLRCGSEQWDMPEIAFGFAGHGRSLASVVERQRNTATLLGRAGHNAGRGFASGNFPR